MNQLIQSNEWPSVLFETQLPDGRSAGILPLTFGRARIYVMNKHFWGFFDDVW